MEKHDQAIIDGKFRTLSFICACLVVLIHAYSQPEAGSWWNVFYGIVGGGAYGTGGVNCDFRIRNQFVCNEPMLDCMDVDAVYIAHCQ